VEVFENLFLVVLPSAVTSRVSEWYVQWPGKPTQSVPRVKWHGACGTLGFWE